MSNHEHIPWPKCRSCRTGFEPRPAVAGSPSAKVAGPPDLCRSCARMCRKCGEWFETLPEERAAQDRALAKHLASKAMRPIPQKLPDLCLVCRARKVLAPEKRDKRVVQFRRRA